MNSNFRNLFLNIVSDIDQGRTERKTLILQEDLGLNLLLQNIRKHFDGTLDLIELNCNSGYSNLDFLPLEELYKTIEPEREESDWETLIEHFTDDVNNERFASSLIIFGNVQSYSPLGFDRLLFILDRFRDSNLNIIVCFNEFLRTSISRKDFEKIISSETDSVTDLKALTQDQFEYLLTGLGYKIPREFSSQLFRLSMGNSEIFRYAMSFYREKSIILENKKINEKLFRTFPIPPAFDEYFSLNFRSMGELERAVLYTISLTGNSTVSDLEDVFNNDGNIRKVIDYLAKKTFILVDGNLIKIGGSKLSGIVNKILQDDEKDEVNRKIINSKYSSRLPINIRMHLLWSADAFEPCTELLQTNINKVVLELKSLAKIETFVYQLRRKYIDDELEKLLSLLVCEGAFTYANWEVASGFFHEFLEDYSDDKESCFKIVEMQLDKREFEEAGRTIEYLNITDRDGKRIVSQYHLYLARIYIETGKLDLVKGEIDQSVSISGEISDSMLQAEGVYVTGKLHMYRKEYSEAAEYFKLALEHCRGSGGTADLRLRINGNLAIVEANMGMYEESLQKFYEILNETYYNGDRINRAYTYFNILEIFEIEGDMKNFQTYFKNTINSIEILKNPSFEFEAHRISYFYHLRNTEFEEAKAEADKCILLAKEVEQPQWVNMSVAMGEIAESYLLGKISSKNWDFISKGFEVQEDILPSYYGAGLVYFILAGNRGRFEETLETLRKFNEETREFYGEAVYQIARVCRVLLGGSIEDFMRDVDNLDEEHSRVGIHRATKKVFKLISRMDKMDSLKFDLEFESLEKELSGELPKFYSSAAMAFRGLFELRIRGKSEYLEKKLSAPISLSPLTLNTLKGEQNDAD